VKLLLRDEHVVELWIDELRLDGKDPLELFEPALQLELEPDEYRKDGPK